MLIPLFLQSCTEPFNLESIDFEDALIVEAIITDEVKHQEIKISRTFSLEEFTPSEENNAKVIITDNSQNIYEFEETSSGKYTSIIQFGASENSSYTLSITTEDGKLYASQPTQMPGVVSINNLYASREVSAETGYENMIIYIGGFDPSANTKYFRYEYEETYEIVAPSWVPGNFFISSTGKLEWGELCCRPVETKVCYNTVASDSIVQLKADNFSQSNSSVFPIRVLSRDNPIIRTRYSILVKQYAQSLEAYTFYKILNKFSNSDNLFSQNQPGFVSGNLYSVNNQNEKVVGFFDISSVSIKRIFFSYSDFFPDEPLPPYFEDCNPFLITDPNVLKEKVLSNDVVFFSINLDPEALPYVVEAACGDCTKEGTSTKPEFWID
jgi:hypothetical protein